MPRTKGSRNKKSITTAPEVMSVEAIEAAIAAAEEEVAKLAADLKAKKAELKALVKEKEAAVAAEAERKAEEDKKAIMDAIAASGKTVEEILELLK